MKLEWLDGFKLSVHKEDDEIVIKGNKEALLSLARQLEALALEEDGSHIHYDKYNSLEEDSIDMIIEKGE